MRELILMTIVIILISASFSVINSTAVYNLLTNCTNAANKYPENYHTWIDCLNRTSFILNGSYEHNGSVLFLRGYEKYNFEIDSSSKKVNSTSAEQVVYILPNGGNYTIKVSSPGYVTKTENVKLNLGDFKYLYFELEKNTTTKKNQTSNGGSGLPANTFVDISNNYIKNELESLKDTLGLTNDEVEYQEKVLDYAKVKVKYYLFVTPNANTLYYYIYNNWNQTINVTVVIEIPKTISQDLNGVSLRCGYKIIKNDPVVSWDLNIEKGKSTYVEYTTMNNITSVTPPVLLFHGVKLPETNQTKINQTNQAQSGTLTLNNSSANNKTQINNQTKNINQSKTINKSNKHNYLPWILMVIGIGAGIGGVGGYLYFFRKKPHEIVEKSLNQIEKFTG